MKHFLLLAVLISGIFSLETKASSLEDSLYQVVTFNWNGEDKELDFVGTGSGTSIEVDANNRLVDRDLRTGIITNKHVVTVGDEIVDFILLCPQKDMSVYLKVKCNVPAAVTAVHPELDLAIVKPLAKDFFLLPTRVIEYQSDMGSTVRLMGYPAPDESLAGGGSDLVFSAFSEWDENGGILEVTGTNPTLTRGEIVDISNQQGTTRDVYYLTNAKGNFGLSGGGAFSTNGEYIGIPTAINQNNDTFVLAYILLEDWIKENISVSPTVPSYITDFYNSVTSGKTRTYEDVTISEDFVTESLEPLHDVNKNIAEGKAAIYLYDNEIISGRPDGSFDGEAVVTRAELAKFLMLAKGADVSNASASQFTDLEPEAWYENYINKAAELGIINGYPDGTYKPGKTVNTAEFLKMLTLSLELNENLDHRYIDVNESDWFNQYAGLATKLELFPNRSISNLEPGRELTRNEVAVAIWKVLTLYDYVDEVLEDNSKLDSVTFDSEKSGIELVRAATRDMPMVEIVEQNQSCEIDDEKNKKYENSNGGVYWKCSSTAYFNNPFAYLAVQVFNAIITDRGEVMTAPLFSDMPDSSVQVVGGQGDIANFDTWISVPMGKSVNDFEFIFPVVMADGDEIVEIANLSPIKKNVYDRYSKYKVDLHNWTVALVQENYGEPVSIEKAFIDELPVEYWKYTDGTKFLFVGGKVQMWDMR